ncbi:tautomerase family protein [Labrys wisconsinensis]|uniref:4-oxalocrotonate tautomerase n=1 Tax=Labrys wisconsinensis TaxID=425677 RepID=A0ABU0JAT9_9HYPH|nr:tautomerase family protein [Labrys wisconsinensis]MDQ0471384.1 4-oxalocrotonate tautomerase [Labrys wisconsinensis]
MPEVYIYALQGKTLDQKRKLVKEVTEAVARNLDVAEDTVLIQLMESSQEAKAKGGVLFSDRATAAKT